MANETKIGWADATWSPWRGCVKVSEGCANCYAEKGAKRNPKVLGTWGPNGPRVVNADWTAPKLWAAKAAAEGQRLKLFPSLCDPFEDYSGPMADHLGNTLESVTMNDTRASFWNLIHQTRSGAVWLLLTKRPENAAFLWDGRIRPAWLIASAENQAWHDKRAWHLARVSDHFAGTGFSIEPQLGPVRLKSICRRCTVGRPHFLPLGLTCCPDCGGPTWRPGWVIIGGESGGRSRPWFVEWGRSLIGQCRDAVIPVFMKQFGSWPLALPSPWALNLGRGLWRSETGSFDPRGIILTRHEGEMDSRSYVELGLKHPKGEDSREWPADLRVQEFPTF